MKKLGFAVKKAMVVTAAATAAATALGGALLPGAEMTAEACSTYYTVTGTTYYLALRNGCSYNSKNEIGKLYNGETVEYIRNGKNGYWYVYSPRLNKYGYVNADYLTGGYSYDYDDYTYYYYGANDYTVSDTTYYLALRYECTYDSDNEIGKLYNGETVEYICNADNGYWYVYSPRLDMYGYVNSRFLK